MTIKIPPLTAMSTYNRMAKAKVNIEADVRTLYIEDNVAHFRVNQF